MLGMMTPLINATGLSNRNGPGTTRQALGAGGGAHHFWTAAAQPGED